MLHQSESRILLLKEGAAQSSRPWFSKADIADMRIPDDYLKCVVFIGTKTESKFIPNATGFLVSRRDQDFTFVYVVTAEHVVTGLSGPDKKIFVRVNTKSGGAVDYEAPFGAWVFHPDEKNLTDVAVSFLMPNMEHKDEIDIKACPLSGSHPPLATEQVCSDSYIGPGDQIAVLGLFRSHYGADHNIPVVRIGSISALKSEPIFTKYCGYTDAHLIEANSIAGLSGSPVFVTRPDTLHLPDNFDVQKLLATRFLLLGLMHGHFDVQNLNEDVVSEDVGSLRKGVNSGMGVVIPVEKIIETIEHPDLVEARDKFVKIQRAENGATSDSVDVDRSDPPATEDNPSHEADFNRLLDAATQTPKSTDQT